MLNIMLDGLPTDFDGYLIRTDFRIGMQISQALNDVNLAEPEKMAVALDLLYGKGIPADRAVAEKGLAWYMRGGTEPTDNDTTDSAKPPVYDFEQDNRLIYSAFLARYRIDLTRERLHWFSFLAMLSDISGSALSDIMGIRATDTSKLSGEQKKRYTELQARYRIKPQLSDAEQAAIEEFESQFN